MQEAERALVFGEDASGYERFRPGYPPEIVEQILALTEVEFAIEIGAGTGKATEAIAGHGRTVVAVAALIWNVPRSERFLEPLYQEHAPSLVGFNRGSSRRDWGQELGDAGFESVGSLSHEWSETLPADDFAALSGTYSHHMSLPEGQRARLLEAIAKAVDDDPRLGIIQYMTDVFYGFR